ncbi:MAG TPA: hypothetical protein V6D29_03815 [Leptolyngbyaceae cyanobacterium]
MPTIEEILHEMSERFVNRVDLMCAAGMQDEAQEYAQQLADQFEALAAGGWDPKLHPRYPVGHPNAGQFMSLKDIGKAAAGKMGEAAKDAVDKANAYAKSVGTTVQDAAQGAKDKAEELVDKAKPKYRPPDVRAGEPMSKEDIKKEVKDIVDDKVGDASAAAKSAAQAVKNLFSGLEDAAGKAGEKVGDAANQAKDKIGDAAGKMKSRAGDVAKSVSETAGDLIDKSGVEKLVSTVGEKLSSMKKASADPEVAEVMASFSMGSDSLKQAKDSLDEKFDSAKGSIQDSLSKAKGLAADTPERVGQLLDKLKKNSSEMFTKGVWAADDIQDTVLGAVDAAKEDKDLILQAGMAGAALAAAPFMKVLESVQGKNNANRDWDAPDWSEVPERSKAIIKSTSDRVSADAKERAKVHSLIENHLSDAIAKFNDEHPDPVVYVKDTLGAKAATLKNKADAAGNAVKDAAGSAKDKAASAADSVKNAAGNAKASAQEKVDKLAQTMKGAIDKADPGAVWKAVGSFTDKELEAMGTSREELHDKLQAMLDKHLKKAKPAAAPAEDAAES